MALPVDGKPVCSPEGVEIPRQVEGSRVGECASRRRAFSVAAYRERNSGVGEIFRVQPGLPVRLR
jgi:hypothetical protein